MKMARSLLSLKSLMPLSSLFLLIKRIPKPRQRRKLISLFVIFLFCHSSHAEKKCSLFFSTKPDFLFFETQLNDTLASLEAMRGKNGLVVDTIGLKNKKGQWVAKNIMESTSPTNIAVDLLVLAESIKAFKGQGRRPVINQVLRTLQELEFHHESGLFFSRYEPNDGGRISDRSVSSIDNLHLALALKVLELEFPKSSISQQASQLFRRMDFSVFVDPTTHLIGGNLKWQESGWVREAYNFSHFGSEGRLLYSLGWALNLFKKYDQSPNFFRKAFNHINFEFHKVGQRRLLKLWDGSAFQLYFPKMFIEESLYSKPLDHAYREMAEYMIREGRKRRLNFPAAHSATRAQWEKWGDGEPAYKDKSGNISLTSRWNRDLDQPDLRSRWNTSFSPYAFFMASTTRSDFYQTIHAKNQRHQHSKGNLYVNSWGWMDSVFVDGPLRGEVIPVQLSLNQAMIALSLFSMTQGRNKTLSAQSFWNETVIRERLETFHRELNEKLMDSSIGFDSGE